MKLIIAILLLAIGAFAQNPKYKDGSECHYCDSIHTHTEYEYTYEVPYSDGVRNGYEVLSYNSIVLQRSHYINDNLMSLVSFDTTGKLTSETHYNTTGSVLEDSHYSTNGFNTTKFYITTGSVMLICTGKIEGFDFNVKWYYETGKLAGTATYKNGKLVGYTKCTDGRFGNESLDCLK